MNHQSVGKGSLPLLLLSPVFLLLWSCGKGPTKADVKESNQPPETYISSTSLTKTAAETDSNGVVTNLNQFSYSVDYTGVDADGKVDSFAVRVDGGPWSAWTEKRKAAGTLEFASQTAAHTFEVKALDNEGTEDPSPAKATLSLALFTANKAPTTAITSGPPNGATSGRGVKFEISGADEDGNVASFIYTVDGGSEVSVAADAEGKAAIEFSKAAGNLFTPGNHAISVRSVDNLGAQDPTAETRSFFVTTGFKPLLSQTDGPPPGGGWFTGANIPFAWSASTSHYFGFIDHFEYSIDDPVNFTSTTASQVALDPQPAGQHTFRLRAVDIGENVSDILTVDFEVALFAPTQGILFIDNVSFNPSTDAYADEPDGDQKILDGFFKNFNLRVSVWDVDRLSGSNRFPGAINATDLPGPGDLANYSSVVIMSDGGYSIDDISPLLAAYFQAGGNLMITGYQTADFGQVLKDVMGTPSIFNGFGTEFQSLEGYQTTSGNNSNAYGFITGPDVVPLIPGVTGRTWEITSNVAPRSLRILFANVGAGGAQGGNRIATEVNGDKGNFGVWVGMSLIYLDQTSSGIVRLGDFILGDRFKEQRN